jgi:hypothetical protein
LGSRQNTPTPAAPFSSLAFLELHQKVGDVCFGELIPDFAKPVALIKFHSLQLGMEVNGLFMLGHIL